jgi:hypothetical protein
VTPTTATTEPGKPDQTVHPEGERIGQAALGYAWHGWPILPGTWPTRRQADGWPVPFAAALPYCGPMSTNDVVRYWHQHDYPVLLAAGLTIDVLEVRRSLGADLLQRLDQHGPVAVLPNGHWLLFVKAGQPPSDELLRRKVRYHGAGSWVPLPPTQIGRGTVHWHIDPASVRWRPFRHISFDSVPRTVRPPRRPPTPQQAQLSNPQPSTPPSPSRSYEPRPRHHALLLTSDRPVLTLTLSQEA